MAQRDSVPAVSEFPRVLYVGDVPVESSYHGSALLFRLFQDWPPEVLRIIEGNLLPSQPDRRLPNVHYESLRVGWRRPLYTRFARWYSAWLSWTAARRVRQIPSLLSDFEPQAIVTATHGFSWLTAAAFARQRGLPLHLICHDDLPRVGLVPQRFASWFDRQFRQVYRSAASRLCVSPFMRDAYRIRYGSDGTVLYPSRAADCPVFDTPPERLKRNDHTFTVAFGGTINSPGYMRALKALATALEILRGRLLIFGPVTAEAAKQNDLAAPNIILCGLVTSGELMARFREEVDVLYVPMSFDSADRANMEAGFPSKLTDYTAVGLPLLVYGPPYCTAVRWAGENGGVAEVVENESPDVLSKAVQRLADSPASSLRLLGERALGSGRRYFALETVQRVFHNAVVLKPSQPVKEHRRICLSLAKVKALFNHAALGVFRMCLRDPMAHLSFLLRSNPEISDRWGYHIRPIHYYEPLPDFRAITETQTKQRRDYQAIDFKWQEQLRLISELGASYHVELEELAQQKGPDGFDFNNSYFSGFDAAIYYALIRHLKPGRVIEIGGGYSTRIADIALARNRQQGKPGKLTCIEPYPEPRLTEVNMDIELLDTPVEEIGLEFFSCLEANDILFIDSSHTVKFRNDVCTNSSRSSRA